MSVTICHAVCLWTERHTIPTKRLYKGATTLLSPLPRAKPPCKSFTNDTHTRCRRAHAHTHLSHTFLKWDQGRASGFQVYCGPPGLHRLFYRHTHSKGTEMPCTSPCWRISLLKLPNLTKYRVGLELAITRFYIH